MCKGCPQAETRKRPHHALLEPRNELYYNERIAFMAEHCCLRQLKAGENVLHEGAQLPTGTMVCIDCPRT